MGGINGLSLAYIGDAVYELYIRKYILSLGYQKVNALHNYVISFTNGISQAEIIHYFMENNILSDDEIAAYKKGRNSHINTSRKNMKLSDYLDATGFEALIGYLYLQNKIERLESLINLAIDLKKEVIHND